MAGANLRAIWTAERIYWLDNRSYTTSLDVLVNQNLLDPSITSNTSYTYLVTSADVATFTATAQRALQRLLVRHHHNHAGRRAHGHPDESGPSYYRGRLPVKYEDP